MADQRHLTSEALEALAQGSWSVDDDRLEGDHRLRSALDSGVARYLEVADHLHGAGARLRSSPGLAAENSAGRVLGVQRISLALLVPDLAIGAIDLNDTVASTLEEARQACTIGACPLDPEGANGTKGSSPGLHLVIASAARRQVHCPKAGSQPVDGDSSMGFLVGVNADDDPGGIGLSHSSSSASKNLTDSCERTGL